ncbi:hypothetical protein ACTMU2_38140 [Cupriavidus basilensis]
MDGEAPQDVRVGRQYRDKPQDIANKMGAEIIRLWVASDRLTRASCRSPTRSSSAWWKATRRIRNTLRFPPSNLSDYDHAKHAPPASEYRAGDRPRHAPWR